MADKERWYMKEKKGRLRKKKDCERPRNIAWFYTLKKTQAE